MPDLNNLFNSILKDPESQPLEVPEHLEKPAGAVVAADGTVACIGCGSRLALAAADVVGMGYRCPRCSNQASVQMLSGGRSDIRAHLDERDRKKMYRDGSILVMGGLAMLVGGVALAIANVLESPRSALVIAAAGIGVTSLGVTRMRAAR